jgi:hypothetical protein
MGITQIRLRPRYEWKREALHLGLDMRGSMAIGAITAGAIRGLQAAGIVHRVRAPDGSRDVGKLAAASTTIVTAAGVKN